MRSGGAHQHDRVQKEEMYLVYFYLSKTFSPHAVGIVSGMNGATGEGNLSRPRVANPRHEQRSFTGVVGQ